MKTLILPLLITIFLSNSIQAQSSADWWYFGYNAGIHFSKSGPKSDNDGQIFSNGACSSISNEDGDLLFYTDGAYVYDASHNQMPNGSGLAGITQQSKRSIIVSMPGSSDEYYVLSIYGDTNSRLYYSKVDLSLNGGMGDVDTNEKDVFLADSTVGGLVSIVTEGKSWIVTHRYLDDEMLTFEVTNSGINTSPIITNTGHIFYGGAYTTLTASPLGDRIATHISNSIMVYYLNHATGKITDTWKIDPVPSIVYSGLSFSPDGKLLYSQASVQNQLIQFDLSLESLEDIGNSGVILGTLETGGGDLQLGPDGKLYVARSGQSFISVINKPNVVGEGCDFESEAVDLGDRTCRWHLPSFSNYNAVVVEDTSQSTGIDFNDNSAIKELVVQVYPIPANSEISLISNSTGVHRIEVLDLTGKVVLTESIELTSAETSVIKLNSLDKGIYSMSVTLGDSRSDSKLIIE